jgi:GNAT superfamily N-acetyltransferase
MVAAMHDVAIARATPADLAAAWAIVSEYYDAIGVIVRDDERELADHYLGAGAGAGVWLARRGDAVVGCIALRPLPQIAGACEVKRLFVQPASRGLRIAEQLLAALHDGARAAGYRAIYLDTKDDLVTAIRFYERHGYARCARYNDNPQATVFMQRDL